MFVKQFHNKNQFVLSNESGTKHTFQSYKSKIATVQVGGPITLYPNWNKSHTTLKHLYAFLLEYGGRAMCKKEIEKELKDKNGYIKMKKYKHNPQPFKENEFYYQSFHKYPLL